MPTKPTAPAKMDPKIKAKWLRALRSGKYTQGRGALRNDNTFCCLGVLCDLHFKAGVLKTAKWGPGPAMNICDMASSYGTTTRRRNHTFLPTCVIKWAKFPKYDGQDDHEGLLANINDRHNSFAETAAYIERHL